MRASTLIATADTAYTEHISEYISQYHADTIEIGVCNTAEQLREVLSAKRYNIALIDPNLVAWADLDSIDMPMLLWADDEAASTEAMPVLRRVRKYKRISLTIADILEQYAAITGDADISGGVEGRITAIWSPSGGTGKTTVALAYAAAMAKEDKEVFYLNLESFATTPAYFHEQGKSISSVFEMLDSKSGNVKMLVQGIRSCENGIHYLCAPDNFDDISILTPENICELVTSCAGTTGQLVIDLSCTCDMRMRQVFVLADKVLLVTDSTPTAKTKLTQFVSQSDVYEGIKEKTTLVVNRHRAADADNARPVFEGFIEPTITLPLIQSGDEQYVYKMLISHMEGICK